MSGTSQIPLHSSDRQRGIRREGIVFYLGQFCVMSREGVKRGFLVMGNIPVSMESGRRKKNVLWTNLTASFGTPEIMSISCSIWLNAFGADRDELYNPSVAETLLL